ncbi:riboflavin synthase alpha chain [Butyrivibrio fibrisolvens DSM 3071]|uniref:Riboflavin synthase n=1 Tax=Butyrivibrio fibrisolvens DSM 3071 TaxID=1121131 RepID=A0A1M6G1K5_BUTFI|nr:riboflavin synthase [Butyrivibrio fibrisolvens]SHJ03846.1 riboflavin synthase alpha chain [Butyrivibrio fibrisolvens DSM 3071]
MFTGIVEEKGKLLNKHLQGSSSFVKIGASKVLEGTRIGDSIAVNGVCLTVTAMDDNSFIADVMPETLRRTNLGDLYSMAEVNLERAMAADGRFGGHIVSGHIDGTGTVVSLVHEGNAVVVTIEAKPEILDLIIEKGSICIDGISLTVVAVTKDSFSVSVIPHTGSETTLLDKKRGDKVNLENDVIAKYVQKLLGANKSTGITMDFLAEHGF